jgi:glycosyltransferase involved in cell wall biosynthesis
LKEANIAKYSVKSFQRNISFSKEMVSVYELAKIIREFDPDIVHLNSSKAGGTGAFVSRLLGVPLIIFTAHGWPYLEPRNIIWKTVAWLGSFATGILAHKVIVVSQNDKTHGPTYFVQKKSHMIHTAIPSIPFLERESARSLLYEKEMNVRHQNDTWLITNGELTHNKNLFVAIDAVATYNEKHKDKIFYSIMSDGELREKLNLYIQKKNMSDYITLLGYINDGRNYLKAFDIFLLPSKKEGLPYSILEAGAAGLPTVASNVGGIPEVIENNKTGKLIDPNNHYTIVEALENYIKNSAEGARHASTLHLKINKDYMLDGMIAKTNAVYEDTNSRT